MMGFDWRRKAPLSVRCEPWSVPAPAALPWFAFASDLHLCAGREDVVAELWRYVRRRSPPALLLGGDLVDRASGLARLERLLRRLARRTRVLVVPGNHDHQVGLARVRSTVEDAGASWLPDQPDGIALGPEGPFVFASADHPAPRHPAILLAHAPAVFEAARRQGYGLTLAGHLHGGQAHLFQVGERSYPGVLVSRWNGARFDRPDGTLLVSNGMADTFPLRFQCPRDLIEVHPTENPAAEFARPR